MSITAALRFMPCNYMLRYLEGICGEGVVCPNRGNKVSVDSGSHRVQIPGLQGHVEKRGCNIRSNGKQ